MHEIVSFDPIKIRGHCRIELYDAETGELTDAVEGDNFIANSVLSLYLKAMQKNLWMGCPNGGLQYMQNSSNNNNIPNCGVFRYIVLTDSTTAEDPTNEYSVPGNMVGWAYFYTYIGTDTHEGSINLAESFANEDMCHWVFDWPTNAGNGTINSVCWAYIWPENPGAYMVAGGNNPCLSANLTWLAKLPRTYGWLAAGGGYIWGFIDTTTNGVTTTTLYKIDPTQNYQEIATYAVPSPGIMYNLTYLDGCIYYFNNSGYLTCYNLSTQAATSSSTYVSQQKVCTTDGTYLYAISTSTSYSYTIYRYNPSTLALVDSKNIDNGGTNSIYYYNNLFFLSGVLYGVIGRVAQEGTNPTNPNVNNGIASINYAAGTCTFVDYFQDSNIFSDTEQANLYQLMTGSFIYESSTWANTTHQLCKCPNPGSFQTYNLMARKLLSSPIIKTSSQTMKVIYEFHFS